MESLKEEIKCLECERVCFNIKSFGMHLSKTHKIKHEAYTLKWQHNNVRPVCECGCGKETSWSNVHHKFMTYKSGHNNPWSTNNQPQFTQKQIEYRNSKIKEAYTDPTLRQKISNTVTEALSTPDAKLKMSNAQKRIWSDPIYKEKASLSRKRVWYEQYDYLCEKIFTDEFRQKISEANMRRDIKRQSVAEIAFFDHLKTVIPDVQTSVWMNNLDLIDKKKTFCFDGKVDDFLIEFDGVYWHGLDRNKNWNNTQISNISNDLKKSLATSQNNLKLIRIKEGVNLSEINSLETLFDAAYYIQVGESVLKGSQCVINEDDILDKDNQVEDDSLLEFLFLYSLVFDRNIDPKKIKKSNTLKIRDTIVDIGVN